VATSNESVCRLPSPDQLPSGRQTMVAAGASSARAGGALQDTKNDTKSTKAGTKSTKDGRKRIRSARRSPEA